MEADKSEREVTKRAFAVVATIVFFLAIGVAFVWRRSALAPAPIPDVADEIRVASAVQQGVKDGQVAIQKVNDLVPGITCHQVQLGETMKVTLVAGRDYYDPGKFKLADAPAVAGLALGVADVYEAFRGVRSNQFEVEFEATGTADAIPIQGGIDYDGRALSCLVEGKYLTLTSGPNALDNKLLACARAAAVAEYLDLDKKVRPIHIKLQGQEYGKRDGHFRSVDLAITFIGLLRYAPDADFCGKRSGPAK